MSKENNWRHYHLERNGNSQSLHFQRYRRAWELIASLARKSPEDTWRGERVQRNPLPCATKGGHRMTAPVTAEEKAKRAEFRLREALLRLADQGSVLGVKAALALAQSDGVDVPTNVLFTIKEMETADNQ